MNKTFKAGFFLITFLSVFFIFNNWTVEATPEQDEGPIEKDTLEDDAVNEKNEAKTFNNQARSQNKTFKIFLDPGHGGGDPGAQYNGLNEKDVVLDIASETKKVLDNEYEGVETKMSRTTDKSVELTDRAQLANEWGADFFTSFHLNSFDGTASGFESYIYNGNVSDETKVRQDHVHTYLADRLEIDDRGKKVANFSVLRNTAMSALLLEYMFIDDEKENELLQKDSYREHLGKLTADAIADRYDLNKK